MISNNNICEIYFLNMSPLSFSGVNTKALLTKISENRNLFQIWILNRHKKHSNVCETFGSFQSVIMFWYFKCSDIPNVLIYQMIWYSKCSDIQCSMKLRDIPFFRKNSCEGIKLRGGVIFPSHLIKWTHLETNIKLLGDKFHIIFWKLNFWF